MSSSPRKRSAAAVAEPVQKFVVDDVVWFKDPKSKLPYWPCVVVEEPNAKEQYRLKYFGDNTWTTANPRDMKRFHCSEYHTFVREGKVHKSRDAQEYFAVGLQAAIELFMEVHEKSEGEYEALISSIRPPSAPSSQQSASQETKGADESASQPGSDKKSQKKKKDKEDKAVDEESDTPSRKKAKEGEEGKKKKKKDKKKEKGKEEEEASSDSDGEEEVTKSKKSKSSKKDKAQNGNNQHTPTHERAGSQRSPGSQKKLPFSQEGLSTQDSNAITLGMPSQSSTQHSTVSSTAAPSKRRSAGSSSAGSPRAHGGDGSDSESSLSDSELLMTSISQETRIELHTGSLVWVRVPNYPWWPSVILKMKEGVDKKTGQKLHTCYVRFFNWENSATGYLVKPENFKRNLKAWTCEESKELQMKPSLPKYADKIKGAVKEAMEFEQNKVFKGSEVLDGFIKEFEEAQRKLKAAKRAKGTGEADEDGTEGEGTEGMEGMEGMEGQGDGSDTDEFPKTQQVMRFNIATKTLVSETREQTEMFVRKSEVDAMSGVESDEEPSIHPDPTRQTPRKNAQQAPVQPQPQEPQRDQYGRTDEDKLALRSRYTKESVLQALEAIRGDLVRVRKGELDSDRHRRYQDTRNHAGLVKDGYYTGPISEEIAEEMCEQLVEMMKKAFPSEGDMEMTRYVMNVLYAEALKRIVEHVENRTDAEPISLADADALLRQDFSTKEETLALVQTFKRRPAPTEHHNSGEEEHEEQQQEEEQDGGEEEEEPGEQDGQTEGKEAC